MSLLGFHELRITNHESPCIGLTVNESPVTSHQSLFYAVGYDEAAKHFYVD